jgi:SAM-dependent methyltransferase
VAAAAPEWLTDILRCPEDGGVLAPSEGGYTCAQCNRSFAETGGIARLLPDHLVHLGGGERGAAAAEGSEVEWVEGEMGWWDDWANVDHKHRHVPLHADRGLRGYARERNLFRHVRPNVGPNPIVVEMGAGSSRTIAGLWPPREQGLRYVATDISLNWLSSGREVLGDTAAAVQCEAGHWPFAPNSVDVVVGLGVLHHLPDWRRALRAAMASVRPGGYMAFHEVIEKPRIFASRRTEGINDWWSSPHEGHVSAEDLRGVFEEVGEILHWRGEASPLRFLLVQYLNLHERIERSRALTLSLEAADQSFGRTFGRVRPSLGFAEVTCVWRARGG